MNAKISVAFLVAAVCLGCQTRNRLSLATLIAHRGESCDAPENTLPAYKTAVERGFGFECDIFLSKDGRLFTFHDGTLTRTTGGANTNRCVDVSWSEVSGLDVGGWGRWKGSRFAGTRPALFEEVLALARPGRMIYVEVKGHDPRYVPYIRAALDREPKATPETVLFITFDEAVCRELKRQLPDYKAMILLGSVPVEKDGAKTYRAPTLDETLAAIRRSQADGVDILYRSEVHTPAFIQAVRDAGYEFHVWTIDDPAVAAEAYARGAQTVTTNRALAILEALEEE